MKRGKSYKKIASLIEGKQYSFKEGIDLLKNNKKETFDETVEVAMNLNVDTRHADQQLRGAMPIPFGSFQSKKILVLSDEVDKEKFIELGATYVGKEEYLDKIKGGWLDFEVMIAQPKEMKDLAKYGRTLGPKGLMPNPKLGTVAQDLEAAIKDIAGGRLEYRTDKGGILHVVIGKASMETSELTDNYNTFINTIKRLRPATVKGDFIKSICLSLSQSPSVQVELPPK